MFNKTRIPILSVLALLTTTTAAARAAEAGKAVRLAPVTVRGAVLELVRIPAGEFAMGSDRPQEKPLHKVKVPAFDLGLTEVTVGQFRAFTEATGYKTSAEQEGWGWVCCWEKPSAATWQSRGYWAKKDGPTWRNPGFAQSDEDPVVEISWQDAAEFCKWLSAETGGQYRLPTEAEWEYAARAGDVNEAPAEVGDYGWDRDNSGLKTQPVARKKPNAFGVYDMLGNAWEWVADVWVEDYTGAPADGSARLEGGVAIGKMPAGEGRPLRGGAWGLERGALRYAARPVFQFRERCNNSGFRIARTVKP